MAINVFSASGGPIGTTEYRYASVDAPPQFVPKLIASTRKTSAGAVIRFDVKNEYPIPRVVNEGVTLYDNTVRLDLTFTSLQGIVATTQMTRVIDETIAFLTSKKAKIIAGDVTP